MRIFEAALCSDAAMAMIERLSSLRLQDFKAPLYNILRNNLSRVGRYNGVVHACYQMYRCGKKEGLRTTKAV